MTDQVRCAHCGTVRPRSDYCPNCGSSLSVPVGEPTGASAEPPKSGGRSPLIGYVVIVAVVLGFGLVALQLANGGSLAPDATSRPIWTQPPGEGAPALSLEKQMTIDVTGCTDAGGSGTVRNGSSVTVDVYVELQYLDSSGTVVDNGLASVQGLRAGETGQWSDQRIDESTIARCRANVGNVFEQ